MPDPQRRKVFIDSDVQGALARRILLHWVCFLFAASTAAFMLQVLSNPFRPLAEHFRDLWWDQGPILLVMVFLLPLFVVDTIKVSHRFAGPIYSLRRAMREVAEGKPARKLKFRTGDFWHGLADDFNALLTRVGLLKPDSAVADEKQIKSDEQQPVGSAK